MKNILEYLLSKKNKNAKSISEDFPEGYCFVCGFFKAWQELCNAYKNTKYIADKTGGNPQGFILKRQEAADWINNKDIDVYEISKKYADINDFKHSYENGAVNIGDDLKLVTLKEL